jgi:hypothetical protein
MLRVAVAALLLGACFSKPAFHGGDDDGSGSDGGVDARRDAPPGGYMDAPDAPPGCATIINEPFTTMPTDPCMPWGTRSGTAMITRPAGTLNMAGPMPSAGGFSGACQSTAFDMSKGTVKVRLQNAPVAGAFWTTSLELTRTAAAETTAIRASPAFVMMTMTTQISMTTHTGTQLGAFTYSPTLVQYLRITATSPTTLRGEYSLDGNTWSAFGDDVYAQPVGTMTLAMRVSAMGTDGQMAIWDDLSAISCP